MITVASFLDRLAPGFYILLAAAFVWNLLKARRTTTQYRAMYFELEREVMRLRRVNAMTALVLIAMVGLTLLGVQRSVLPFLRQVQDIQAMQEEIAVVTDGTFATAVPRDADTSAVNIVPVAPLGGDDTPLVVATPAPTLTPVGTIIPNAAPTAGCTDPRATLTVPANGMRVFQTISIQGTAYTENFSEWKIELNGPSTNNQWSVINGLDRPVLSNQPFAQFSPGEAVQIQGTYQMRLMVFDFTGTAVASCMVNIYIGPPPETPTPTITPAT
jgi:hypothetical protein